MYLFFFLHLLYSFATRLDLLVACANEKNQHLFVAVNVRKSDVFKGLKDAVNSIDCKGTNLALHTLSEYVTMTHDPVCTEGGKAKKGKGNLKNVGSN